MKRENCTLTITRPTGEQVRNGEYSERDWIYLVTRTANGNTIEGVAYSKKSAIDAAIEGIKKLNW